MSGSFDVEALLAEEEAKAVAANARRARQASGSNTREDGGRLSYTIREKPNFDRSSNDRDVRADGGRLSYSTREKRSRDRDGDEAMTSSPFDKSNAHDSAREKHDHHSSAFVVDTNPDPNYRARLQSDDLLDNKRHVLGEGRLSSVKDEFEDSDSKNKKDSHEDEGRLRSNDRYHDRRSESRHSGTSRDVRSDRYRGDGYYPGGRRRSRSPGDSYRPRRDDRDDRDRRSRDDRDRRDDRDYRDRRDDRDRDRYRDGRRERYDDRNRERGGRRHEERRNTSSPARPRTPEATEDERDRRTVFVQQLAARLRSKDLIAFFEKVGPVKEAQIVKDRVSGRSKG